MPHILIEYHSTHASQHCMPESQAGNTHNRLHIAMKDTDDKWLVTVTGCVQASSGMQCFTSWITKQLLMKSRVLSDKNCVSCNAATVVAMSGTECFGVHQPSLSLASLKKWGAQQGAAYMRSILPTRVSAAQHVFMASDPAGSAQNLIMLQQPPQPACNQLNPYN